MIVKHKMGDHMKIPEGPIRRENLAIKLAHGDYRRQGEARLAIVDIVTECIYIAEGHPKLQARMAAAFGISVPHDAQ